MKKIFTILITVALSLPGLAQYTDEARSAWLIKPSIAFQMPRGDWAHRFGNNFSAGLGASYKTVNNWSFGIDGQYMFRDAVNNPREILKPILTEKGFVINPLGTYASVSVLQRGFYFTGEVRKAFKILNINTNSGPDIQLGAGYMMHWVEIKNAGNDSPQIIEEYTKGYDHLSAGFLLKQSIGYTYLSTNRRINFRISYEMMQAFTENLRGFDYSTGRAESGQNLDVLHGFRFQWMLPIYQGGKKDTYYYD